MEDPPHATLGLSVKRQIALDATNPHHFVEFQAPFAISVRIVEAGRGRSSRCPMVAVVAKLVEWALWEAVARPASCNDQVFS